MERSSHIPRIALPIVRAVLELVDVNGDGFPRPLPSVHVMKVLDIHEPEVSTHVLGQQSLNIATLRCSLHSPFAKQIKAQEEVHLKLKLLEACQAGIHNYAIFTYARKMLSSCRRNIDVIINARIL